MTCGLFFSLIGILGVQCGQAQDSLFARYEPPLPLIEELPFVQPDSLPVSLVRRPKLLPDKLGFFERNLWTEDGLLRSLGIAAPLTPESRKSELKLRRAMLVAHETSGFVTLGLMLTTVYYGQKVLDNYPAPLSMRRTHIGFADATITTYSLTALLSLLSPPPTIRRDEMNSLSYHRALAWIHVSGMIITPIIASIAQKRGASDKTVFHIHQVSAYITTAAFAASMVVMTF
jgi:hypothetical protein